MTEMTNLEMLENTLENAISEAKKAESMAKAAVTKASKAGLKAKNDEAKAKAKAKAEAKAAEAKAKADEAKAKAEAIQAEYDEAKAKAEAVYALCDKSEANAEAKAKAAEAEAAKPAKKPSKTAKAKAAENKRKIDEAKAEAKAKAAEAAEAEKAAAQAALVALVRVDKARTKADNVAVKAMKKAFDEGKDLTAESVSDTLYNIKIMAISRRFEAFNCLVNNEADMAEAAEAEAEYRKAVYDYCSFVGIVNKSAFFALIGTALYSLRKVGDKNIRIPFEYKTQFRRISTLASGIIFDSQGAYYTAFKDFMHNYKTEAEKAEAKAERILTAAEKEKSNFDSLVTIFNIDKESKAYIDKVKNLKNAIDEATKAKAEAKAANEAAKALTYADFVTMWNEKNSVMDEKYAAYEAAEAEAAK